MILFYIYLALIVVDLVAGEFDPTAAITTWKYEVEQEEPGKVFSHI